MTAPRDSDAWVPDYFAHHLGSRLGRPLLPGLASVPTSSTIDVTDVGAWSVAVVSGVITRCGRATGRDPYCHVTLTADDLARIVCADVTPQGLFVRRRLRIEGDVLRALSAALALEEFFARYPYRPSLGTAREVSA